MLATEEKTVVVIKEEVHSKTDLKKMATGLKKAMVASTHVKPKRNVKVAKPRAKRTIGTILQAALELIKKGWTKNQLANEAETRVCLVGAIHKAVTGSAHAGAASGMGEVEAMAAAMKITLAHIPSGYGSIPGYNDDPSTKKSDVVRVLKEAIGDPSSDTPVSRASDLLH